MADRDCRYPLGRRLELPGRGTTFVRELDGPPGAPTLVLLHGWMASGAPTGTRCSNRRRVHFRVIAPDLRGHARGIRSWRRFRLADCADDVAATMDVLAIESAIMVGYSMGGPVAQLMWKRHPEKVDGLVLCATSHSFVPGVRERLIFTSTMAAAAGTTRVGGVMTAWPPIGAQATGSRSRPVVDPHHADVGGQRDASARLAHDPRGRSRHRSVRRPQVDR